MKPDSSLLTEAAELIIQRLEYQKPGECAPVIIVDRDEAVRIIRNGVAGLLIGLDKVLEMRKAGKEPTTGEWLLSVGFSNPKNAQFPDWPWFQRRSQFGELFINPSCRTCKFADTNIDGANIRFPETRDDVTRLCETILVITLET